MFESMGFNVFLDQGDFTRLLSRFVINGVFVTLLVGGLYYRLYKNRDYVTTHFLLNLVTFSLCALLRKVPAQAGFALAIFAVFGVLRFRTEQMRTIDLTYLFVSIGIGIVNSFSNKQVSLLEVLTVNAFLVAAMAILEMGTFFGKRESSIRLIYDKPALLDPARREELHQDIHRRTGLIVSRVDAEDVNFLRDSVDLQVYYHEGM